MNYKRSFTATAAEALKDAMVRLDSIAIALACWIVVSVSMNALIPSASAAQACWQWDVSGNWGIEQSNGVQHTFVMRQTGTRLLGGIRGQITGTIIGNITGTINGDRVQLQVKWSGGEVATYGGTVSPDGQRIHGLAGNQDDQTRQVQWVAIGYARCVPAPAPAPPPAPPPMTTPQAPTNVSAIRQNGSDLYVSWTGDRNSEWYVVERRVGVAASLEAGSTPWVAASGRLKQGTVQFLAHDPVLQGGLKNIYRVIAYNSAGQAVSAPVAESASKISRSLRTPGLR